MKRKRNSIYHLIASLCVLLGLGSCSDFLEIEPQNEIVLEKFWNEKADVDAIILGAYSSMQSDNVLMRMMIWGEFRSDNITRGQNLTDDTNLENILKENLTASNSYTTWDQFYYIINVCNTVIRYAPAVAEKDPTFSESELRADIAEVSALRDLCYFYLIRTFRDVPYSTVAFTDDDQEMDLPATSFDNVLDSLIADLEYQKDYAVVTYPSGTTTEALYQTSRVTKQAIWAMLCEMYLWKQNYTKCIEYADLVINAKKQEAEDRASESYTTTDYSRTNGYPLISESAYSSSSMFGNAYTEIFGEGNSSESILELTFMSGDNYPSNGAVNNLYGRYDSGLEMGFGSVPSSISDDVSTSVYSVFDAQNGKYDSRYYANILGSSTIGKYVYQDFIITFSGSNASYAQSGVYTEKYNKSNWILYRLTDIMLLKAEALCQLMSSATELSTQDQSYLAQAFSLVNAVNKRSICQSTLKDTLQASNYQTKEQIENLVFEERHRELMFEGKRYYDLVRRARREGSTSYLSQQVMQKFTSGTSAIQDKLGKMDAIYWPYNVDELKVNKNLVQNSAFGSGENGSYDRN